MVARDRENGGFERVVRQICWRAWEGGSSGWYSSLKNRGREETCWFGSGAGGLIMESIALVKMGRTLGGL